MYTYTGFQLNNYLLQLIVLRYSDEQFQIDFDDFLNCLIRLDNASREYPLLLQLFVPIKHHFSGVSSVIFEINYVVLIAFLSNKGCVYYLLLEQFPSHEIKTHPAANGKKSLIVNGSYASQLAGKHGKHSGKMSVMSPPKFGLLVDNSLWLLSVSRIIHPVEKVSTVILKESSLNASGDPAVRHMLVLISYVF